MPELALLLVIILVLGGFGVIYYVLKYELPRSEELPPKVFVIGRRAPEPPPPPPPQAVGLFRDRYVVVVQRKPPFSPCKEALWPRFWFRLYSGWARTPCTSSGTRTSGSPGTPSTAGRTHSSPSSQRSRKWATAASSRG